MSLFRREPEFQITDPAVMKVGEIARGEALRRRVRVVDPPYLLLGLLAVEDALVGDLFRRANVDVPRARARLEAGLPAVVGPPDARMTDRTLAYSGGATRTWERAGEEALAMGERGPAPVHLLIALLRDGGEAGTLLREAGLAADGVRGHLGHLQESAGPGQGR
ncbi:MAG TPA: Clp protease N-terminal domain-containing protein [Longimicrobium sp.]|nr:Clp protease N-terminal domain-containing protein [Longimicrobium sp.]